MSILDKLKSVFVVSEPETGGQTASGDVSAPKEQTKTGEPTEVTSAPITVSGQSAEKFLEILAQVLEKNNQEGFDYLEYKKAVSSVAKLQAMDEATQYKTAYAAAQSMNVQPAFLIESAKKYLSVLAIEEKQFMQSAQQFLQNQVSSKENERVQLTQSIQQKENQIQQLLAEKAKAEQRVKVLQSELETAKQKVEVNKANFAASYQTFVEQIRTDIQKMELHLK
ncbi:MAG TPA: hypothetical protein PK006_07870 [Saprospiraceae bacterium]|nr:hypothetical protein [Saprospiraceae bacterium]